MASVLFVSKPIAPPWNDSGKNLVRDLARGLTRHQATLMVRAGADPEVPGARQAAVYARSSGGFAPALSDQARVLAHLIAARKHSLWHFFFAPNPRSCLAGKLATSLRRVRSVHTLSSAPRDPRAIVPKLFADVNVTLSLHTQARLLEAGLASERLVRIPPAIEPLTPPREDERLRLRGELGLPRDRPVVVYPGDLEFGEGGRLVIEAAQALRPRDVVFVMACRTKTPGAQSAEAALRQRVEQLGLGAAVSFVGETRRIHSLLACADVVALPSVDLYAKMDYPLVLLEAMSLARPVVVARGGAAAELSEGHAALAVEPEPEALAAAVAGLLDDAAARARLGAAAERAVRERFAYPEMSAAYERVYDSLLG